MKVQLAILFLSALFVSSAFASDRPDLALERSSSYFSDSKTPTEVTAAHESFLMGNFDQMALDIKKALMAHAGDEAIQRDLLDLYDKAYELRGNSAISPDWHAPRGVIWLGVSAKKRFRPSQNAVDHRIAISMDYEKGAEIEQLRIVKYPNEVIIDKAQNIGNWSEDTNPDGTLNLWGAADYQRKLVSDGLYLIDIKLKGQETTHGWFLFSRINATESPEATVPSINQVLSTGTPTFQWKDFVSSEFRSYETRRIKIAVVLRADNVNSNTWYVNRPAPFSSITVGSEGNGIIGVKALPADNYIFQLNYAESRQFGDLTVRRESGTHVPFSVKY